MSQELCLDCDGILKIERYCDTCIKTQKAPGPVDKELHEWEQSTKEVKHVIESLTVENANHVVLDPFMGSGTTGIAGFT